MLPPCYHTHRMIVTIGCLCVAILSIVDLGAAPAWAALGVNILWIWSE